MSTRDRRQAPRHVPAQDLAHVGWWDGPEFQHASARLCDLSSTGVALAVNGQSLESESVWICLAGGEPTNWVRTNLAWNTTSDQGEQRVGLIFDGRCPNTLFKNALWGKSAPDPGEAPPPPPPREPQTAPAGPIPAPAETTATDQWTFVTVTAADLAVIGTPVLADDRAKTAARSTSIDWLVPFVVGISFGLTVVVLAFVSFADPQFIDPLIRCLTQP